MEGRTLLFLVGCAMFVMVSVVMSLLGARAIPDGGLRFLSGVVALVVALAIFDLSNI